MSNNLYEKKDRNEAIRQMKRNGYTLREIAEKYGLSFQRVANICGGMTYDTKSFFRLTTLNGCIYPNLKNYLIENQITAAELSRRMYGNSHPTNQRYIKECLEGKRKLIKSTIDRFLKATGLTYEVAFAEEGAKDEISTNIDPTEMV